MDTPERRHVPWRRLGAVASIAVAACLGAGGWALVVDDTATDRPDERPPATSAPSTTTTVPSTTTTAAPADIPLPVPAPAPDDAHAPVPAVVHGSLALPSLGVDQPLHEGVTLTAINRGPSHWPGTAMPGQVGNVVVAGHRTTYTQPFNDLDLLQPGDPLVFTLADGARHTYELTSTEIVAPDAMHILDQTRERTATLFACHPKGSAAQRIVAHFRLVTP